MQQTLNKFLPLYRRDAVGGLQRENFVRQIGRSEPPLEFAAEQASGHHAPVLRENEQAN